MYSNWIFNSLNLFGIGCFFFVDYLNLFRVDLQMIIIQMHSFSYSLLLSQLNENPSSIKFNLLIMRFALHTYLQYILLFHLWMTSSVECQKRILKLKVNLSVYVLREANEVGIIRVGSFAYSILWGVPWTFQSGKSMIDTEKPLMNLIISVKIIIIWEHLDCKYCVAYFLCELAITIFIVYILHEDHEMCFAVVHLQTAVNSWVYNYKNQINAPNFLFSLLLKVKMSYASLRIIASGYLPDWKK